MDLECLVSVQMLNEYSSSSSLVDLRDEDHPGGSETGLQPEVERIIGEVSPEDFLLLGVPDCITSDNSMQILNTSDGESIEPRTSSSELTFSKQIYARRLWTYIM